MDYCKYAIVPTPKTSLCCASCGKKIEGLPYYPQLMHLYTGIGFDDGATNYLGLGLRVPMCDECEDSSSETVKTTETRQRYVSYFLTIATAVSFGMLEVTEWSFVAIGIFLLLYILNILNNRRKTTVINGKMKSREMSYVESAFEYLSQNGWKQNTGQVKDNWNYSEERLRIDLDNICGDGNYSILDSETGQIVDYRNPAVVKDIYAGNILTENEE